MKPKHGTGLRYLDNTMSSLELKALLKKREEIKKRVLLKYRGVTYIKTI